MPTYDYQCEACGHHWEEFQNISEAPIKKCPDCGKKKATRLFGTGAAIVFKGSGFYETDYRSESYKKGQQAAKKAADSKSESSSKSESNQRTEKAESKATSKKQAKKPKSGGGD